MDRSKKSETRGLEEFLKRDPRLRSRFDKEDGVVRYLRGDLVSIGKAESKRLRSAGLRLLEKNAELFGKVKTEDLKVVNETTDPHGGLSLTLQHYRGNQRVFGSSIRFHVDGNGVLDTVNNRLQTGLEEVPHKVRISAEKAVAAARRATGCREVPSEEPELMVYPYRSQPRLAWEVRLNESHPRKERTRRSWLAGEHGAPSRWIVYVDATSGGVLLYYDNIQTAGPVTGLGTGYYSGPWSGNAWFNNTTYQLHDTSRSGSGGPEIRTNDEDGASPSEDSDNNWNDSTVVPRDANQGAEVDAHRFAGDVVDYYETVHGRNSFDGGGGNLTNLVHYLTNLDNGFWDGSKVKLGDGSGSAPGDDYECSDDWLAHEWTHAYTQYTCGLQYLNEAGGLNEALSDTFAAFITGDWLVFEDSWLKATAPASRNMMDPTNGGQWDISDPIGSVLDGHQPSHYDDRYTGTDDNGGVHINSGIVNHLFYLLTVGGTHATSGVTVIGIGQSAAEQMLYRCMSVNLVGNPAADFLDFREAMLDACLDLFPTDLVQLTQVKRAFNAVGIGPDIYVRDNVSDSGEEPYGGSYLYASPDIINRTSPSANPGAEFADLGDDSLWENVEYGQDNYVYVRLQNRGNAEGDATANVYFIPLSSFASPASWIHIGTLTETAVAPGTLRIAGPLTFPSGLIPSPGHYCMIAVVTSPLDPAPDHTLISSVSDYLDFVRNVNNIAYRNMDVVDLIAGAPFAAKFIVGTMPALRERYDLRLDVARFIPGTRLLVRGPAKVLDGAVARELKLVGRREGENTYRVMVGRELARQWGGIGPAKAVLGPEVGFDSVLVERNVQLVIEGVAPDEQAMERIGRGNRRRPFELAIRQLWKGEVVGRAAVQYRHARSQKEEKRRMKHPRR